MENTEQIIRNRTPRGPAEESAGFRVEIRPEMVDRPFALLVDGEGIIRSVSPAVRARAAEAEGRRVEELLRPPGPEGWASLLAGPESRIVETALIGDEREWPLTGFWASSEKGDRVFLGRPDPCRREDADRYAPEELNGTASVLDLYNAMDEMNGLSRGTEKAITALQIESRRLRSLVENAGGYLLVTNRSNCVVLVSSMLLEVLGKKRGEILGRSLCDIIDSEEMRTWAESPAGPDGIDPARNDHFTCTTRLPGPEKRRADWTLTSVTDAEGNRTGFVVFGVDVTAKMNRIEKAERSRDELDTILDRIPFGIVLIGPERKVQWVNSVGMQMAGALEREEMIGRPCGTWCGACEEGGCPVYDEGRYFSNKEMWFRPDEAQPFPVLKSVAPVSVSGQDYLLEVFIDITDRKNMESELEQSRRLESIGQLAAGIAHEINTPTQFLSDNVVFLDQVAKAMLEQVEHFAALLEKPGEAESLGEKIAGCRERMKDFDLEFYREEVPDALLHSRDGIRRISEIVQAMKEFSHPGTDRKTPTDVEQAVRTTATVARNRWKYVADVEIEIGEGLDQVLLHPGEFNQVILNLIVNAADAIAEKNESDDSGAKGTIRIEGKRTGDWAELRISDTGAGIPAEIRDRVFEPFFTTKEVGKGTGQGLAIVRNVIVDKHGGTLRCESEPGAGTTFIVRLPANETKAQDPPIG